MASKNAAFWATQRAAEIKAQQEEANRKAAEDAAPSVGGASGSGVSIPEQWVDEHGIIDPVRVTTDVNPQGPRPPKPVKQQTTSVDAPHGTSRLGVPYTAAQKFRLDGARSTREKNKIINEIEVIHRGEISRGEHPALSAGPSLDPINISPEDIQAKVAANKAARANDAKVEDLLQERMAKLGPEGPFGPNAIAEAKATHDTGDYKWGASELLGIAKAAHRKLRDFIADPRPAAAEHAGDLRDLAEQVRALSPNHPAIAELHNKANALEDHAAKFSTDVFYKQGGINDSLVTAGSKLRQIELLTNQSEKQLVRRDGTPDPIRVSVGEPTQQVHMGLAEVFKTLGRLHANISNTGISKANQASGLGWVGGVRLPVSRLDLEVANQRVKELAAEGESSTGESPKYRPGVKINWKLSPLSRPMTGAAPKPIATMLGPKKSGMIRYVGAAPTTHVINPEELPASQRAFQDTSGRVIHTVTQKKYREGDIGPDGQKVTPHPTHYWEKEFDNPSIATFGKETMPFEGSGK
jgi:hypothetical protein